MSEPIKVGDLVQVVRPSICCKSNYGLGDIFKVTDAFPRKSDCAMCGASPFVMLLDGHHSGLFCDSRRVKLIPPLEELDDVKRDEEITA